MNKTPATPLDFESLPLYEDRQFVPKQADLTDAIQLEQLFQILIDENVDSKQAFEAWIYRRSELESALDQARSILYIRMTTQTDNQEYAQKYTDFIENVSSLIKECEHQLNIKTLALKEKFQDTDVYFDIYLRNIKSDVDLFVSSNIELEKQEALLSQEYQTITGAVMISFEGKEFTPSQMGKFFLDPDRDLRERAWKAVAQARLEVSSKLDEVFDQMLRLRVQIAKNAGCANYCDFKFREYHRFDYTPADCHQYADVVADQLVPLWGKILNRRKQQLGVEALHPWDTAVDVLGRSALKPFKDVDQFLELTQQCFQAVDEELGERFTRMMESGCLDLLSRKGKAPGGYQSTLNESRVPFIFMNAVGLDQDVRTLFHEGGHAFHALASRDVPLLDYRHAPMEFCEVASMAMELLAGEFLDRFYNEEDRARSLIDHLESCIFTLVWVATIDQFQHWIYSHPGHSADERKEAWLAIHKRFGSDFVDWAGLEDAHAFMWHRQLHVFEVPFYYIEYGIAQCGALQVWRAAKHDWAGAVENYKAGLALGGSAPLPDLFKAAGIMFDFSKPMISSLVEEIENALEVK